LSDGRTGAIRKVSIWRDRLPFVNHFYSKQTSAFPVTAPTMRLSEAPADSAEPENAATARCDFSHNRK